jgi:outer membrane lipoprotein-sorting protein
VLRAGEKKNVFKLGEGPFPVPFGQKKKDITDTFTIKLIKDPKDPLGKTTDHLECTPRPNTDLAKRYGKVQFWISRENDLPVKVKTIDKQDNEQSITAIFTDLEINKSLPGSKLGLPALPDYDTKLDPLPPISVDTIDKGIGK